MKNDVRYKLALLFLLLAPPLLQSLRAQSAGMSSPYSRFGIGLLNDQSQGFNRSMAGVGLGVRYGNIVNTMNPASYSAIDSISLILDVGMSASFGKMVQGTKRIAVNNAAFDYAHIGLRLARRLGLAVGYMPYSSIGYEFASPEEVIGKSLTTMQPNTQEVGYSGSGGLSQAYIGLGWRVYKNLSVGVNASFLWGSYYHAVLPVYSDGGVVVDSYDSSGKVYDASPRTYKIDLGVQYPVRLTHQDWLNLGLTAGLGHGIPQDLEITEGYNTDTISSPFSLPYSVAFGVAWQHKNSLLVAADVHHDFWSKCRQPMETGSGYAGIEGGYRDMTKIAVGAQWTPDPLQKQYWKRIRYRAGVSYKTPYLKVNGNDGPSELSLTAGVGLPITNRTNNRSFVNFGLQWLRRSASGTGMISENYLLLNLGLTFNERWFVKYKIE